MVSTILWGEVATPVVVQEEGGAGTVTCARCRSVGGAERISFLPGAATLGVRYFHRGA